MKCKNPEQYQKLYKKRTAAKQRKQKARPEISVAKLMKKPFTQKDFHELFSSLTGYYER